MSKDRVPRLNGNFHRGYFNLERHIDPKKFARHFTAIVEGIPVRPQTAELIASIKITPGVNGVISVRSRRMGSVYRSS